MANFLSKLFGTKADRDMKELRPILEKCLEAYEPISKLSNDELRAKTKEESTNTEKETTEEVLESVSEASLKEKLSAVNAR